MNFRENKGYTGIDISIAILVFVILVPLIIAIAYNISSSGNYTDQKAYAVNIAANTLEIAKSVGKLENVYSKTADTPQTIVGETYITKLSSTMQRIDANNTPSIVNDKITFVVTDEKNNRYKIQTEVTDYVDTLDPIPADAKHNVVKKVTSKVYFSTGKTEQNVEISTIISKY